MALSDDSRYLAVAVIEVLDSSGNLVTPPFLDLRDRITSTAPDDKLFVQDGVNGWANLGVKYLKNARSWWAIADMSGVIDPFTELVNGTRYKAPSISRFYFDMVPGVRGVR